MKPAVLLLALRPLPLLIYTRDMYGSRLEEAASRMGDPKDVDVLALALYLTCPVWTMDSDFRPSGVPVFSTRSLLEVLERSGP
ncbi:MAG: PIN domain-containing protein [Candidatus Xenobia bacterium]